MQAQPYMNKKTGRPGAGRKKPNPTNYIILSQLAIEEGFKLMDLAEREKPYIFDEAIERDWRRWNVLKSSALKCYRCGCRATHWQVEKHKNDHGRPFNLNIYAGKKLLTWDHIIPKSYGGSDDPQNGRIACEPCNGSRGNEMTFNEILWACKQNPMIVYSQKEVPPWKLEVLTWDARFHAAKPLDTKVLKYGINNPYFGAEAPLDPILVIGSQMKIKDLSRSDYARYEQLDRKNRSADLQEQ